MENKVIITGAILQKICPNLSISIAEKIADAITYVAPGYNMNDANILHEFIAQVAYESYYFRVRCESMNYSANRLLQVFPSRFKTISDALPYVNNAEALANYVYAGRLGNIEKDDGYTFRGAGYIMGTGRSFWQAYCNWFGGISAEHMAECARTDIWYAVDSACWFFSELKSLIPAALNNDLRAVTRGVTGSMIGFAERNKLYELCKRYIN